MAYFNAPHLISTLSEHPSYASTLAQWRRPPHVTIHPAATVGAARYNSRSEQGRRPIWHSNVVTRPENAATAALACTPALPLMI